MTRIIDIVIPCAGRAHDLLRLLASIHERCAESLPRLCASITVTDDRSTEALRDEVRRRFPAVNYVAGPSRGPAVNRNHGSTFGSAQWLLFLDDDCYLQAERLKTHRALSFAPAHRTARDKAALGYYGCAVRSWGSGQRVDCLRYTLRSLRSSLTARGVAALLLPLLPQRLAEMRQSLRRTA